MNPVGYRMDTLTCSWKVEETACRRAADTSKIEVGGDADFRTILFSREGADLHSTGEEMDVPLRPRTAYWCRVTVTGEADAGSRQRPEKRMPLLPKPEVRLQHRLPYV
jgi:alpha-L-rhamnosidase